ncbi:hypothetical protein Tco_0966809 [Tanacetum coccineum]
MEVSEIMKISSFMDLLKFPELAKCFSDKAPATVNEMMKRLDDFVRFEKAFAQTELSKGETGEQHRKSYFPPTRRDDRPIRNEQTDHRSFEYRNNYRVRDNALPYRGRDYQPPYLLTREIIKLEWHLSSLWTPLPSFAGEATKPLGKIELEVCFGNEGLCRRKTMKFTVIRAPSPYNVILGRTGLRALRAIPSTIHSMLKFPTPRGIATLVTRSVIISECERLEKKQMIEEEKEA